MRLIGSTLITLTLAVLFAGPALAEVTVSVNADNSVMVQKGWDAEAVSPTPYDENFGYYGEDAGRISIQFPDLYPGVYERESEEALHLLVNGQLPAGADVIFQAWSGSTGQTVEGFEHTVAGPDWYIGSRFMQLLPDGEVQIKATLRIQGKADVAVTHPFYVLNADALADSKLPPWFDWEDEVEAAAGTTSPPPGYPIPFVAGGGFMEFPPPPASAKVYYVSETGNDWNDGLSPASALRTPRKAYEKVRDNSADQVLLKAGETFDGGFGSWKKSGRSAEQPLHIGAYGEGNRPTVLTNGGSLMKCFGRVDNVRLDGIHAYANSRNKGGRPENEGGVVWIGQGRNITLHDCHIEGFSFNIVIQGFSAGDIENVVIFRCIVNNAFADHKKGHSSGLFASYVRGLQVVESTFDRNGWHPDAGGANRTKFNHNIYVQKTSESISVRGSIITRGASHGVQMRPGGDVIENLFVSNALAFFVTWRPSMVINNVVMKSDDISSGEPRGSGIEVMPCVKAVVANNIIAHKVGTMGWMGAIDVLYNSGELDKTGGKYAVEVFNNHVWNWSMASSHKEIKMDKSADISRGNNVVDGALVEGGGRVQYHDPNRTLDTYINGGLNEFLRNAVFRPRGSWDEKFSAPEFNAYMREGFTPVQTQKSGDNGGGSV